LDLTLLISEIERGACFIDEFVLPTLAATDALQVPGGFTHECLDRGHAAPYFTRQTLYELNTENQHPQCVHNNSRNGVCVLGVENVALLLNQSHSLFFNKAIPDFDFGAIHCWHEALYNRTHFNRGNHRLTPYVYKRLPQVRYHVERMKKGGEMDKKSLALFDCAYGVPEEDMRRMFDTDEKQGSGLRLVSPTIVPFMNISEFCLRPTTKRCKRNCYAYHSPASKNYGRLDKFFVE